VGAAMIVASGVFVVVLERRRARASAAGGP
jgi:hypothetical protein